jgi:hypothetical protein
MMLKMPPFLGHDRLRNGRSTVLSISWWLWATPPRIGSVTSSSFRHTPVGLWHSFSKPWWRSDAVQYAYGQVQRDADEVRQRRAVTFR